MQITLCLPLPRISVHQIALPLTGDGVRLTAAIDPKMAIFAPIRGLPLEYCYKVRVEKLECVATLQQHTFTTDRIRPRGSTLQCGAVPLVSY